MKFLAAGFVFIIYVFLSCFGLYLIKAAPHWRSVVFIGGFGLYTAGALLWLVLLRHLPLSFAFPVAAGALIIGTMTTGRILLGENISTPQIAGAALILIGIALSTYQK